MLRSGFSSQSKGGELGRADCFWRGLADEPREESSLEVEVVGREVELDSSSFRFELLPELVEVKLRR